MKSWNDLFREHVKRVAVGDDPAHDLLHFERVVRTARQLCEEERAQLEVVLPAAWLHDLVIVPKNDPRRSQASRLSGEAAYTYLQAVHYPQEYLADIRHAVEAHSFSAGVEPKTLEAKIVQDADRLDGVGAIGIARCFAVAGILNRPFYSDEDPFCSERAPNDLEFTIDHFYKKLLKIHESLHTAAARKEGARRFLIMKNFLESLAAEIGHGP